MKRTLMFLVIVTTGILSFSQAPSDNSKFEIGIGVPCFSCNFSKRIPAPLVSFKVIEDRNAFRSGLIYDLTVPRSLKEYSFLLFNAGYERRFFSSKSKLFLGVDFCYLYKYNCEVKNPANESTFYHIGFGPVIGYIYRFSKRFSFQTEVGFYYGYGQNKYYVNSDFIYDTKGGYFTGHRFVNLILFYHFK